MKAEKREDRSSLRSRRVPQRRLSCESVRRSYTANVTGVKRTLHFAAHPRF